VAGTGSAFKGTAPHKVSPVRSLTVINGPTNQKLHPRTVMVGAELNCELAKVSAQGKIEQTHEPPPITRINFAA
jgi:hypothetical protein